jgi:predicted acetyltransferase
VAFGGLNFSWITAKKTVLLSDLAGKMLNRTGLMRNEGNINIKLERSVADDKEFIKNIHQHYLHDLSEYNHCLQLNSAGLFDNSFVDSYYCDDNLIPLKITLENNIIGFIFCSISSGPKVEYIIQDVFILKGYRNRGLCKSALEQLFNIYPGRYGLVILMNNEPAKSFWEQCLKRLGINYTSDEAVVDENLCLRLFFDSRKSFQPNDENK